MLISKVFFFLPGLFPTGERRPQEGEGGPRVFRSARVLAVSSPYANGCIPVCVPLDGIAPVCVQLMGYLAAPVILDKQSSGIIARSERPAWRSAGPSSSGLAENVSLSQANKLILRRFGINYSGERRTRHNLHDMLASFAAFIF